ncbi:adenosine deaminase [Actinosynnema sp. ALI-1.44]|uniref:adenosine deaminase n=1 Tax=Actinosynnema sp. ALI-1.44 TaxID=1933779 RepID=UPI00097C5E2F|nr:adenosine deaminase [Actinosynnema sp. ALI-1.44]ONI76374.1 adenosine deaminase [Actinosynnema sp. ALI-1.44]
MLEEFVAGLPKVDLHLHLLGAASVPTVAELARRHPRHAVPTEPETLAEYYRFVDFAHFVEVYTAVNRLVTTGEDVVTLITGLAADLCRDNVRYAEVTVTPMSHLKAGVPAQELAEALTAGRSAAARMGVELAWVHDVSGDDGPTAGPATLDWVLTWQPSGTVGFGLGGPEAGIAREWFRDTFAAARAAGLHSVPHAGEVSGPEQVWAAVRELSAERVGHGIAAVQDPSLRRHLAEHRITLEICPTSNLRTRAVAAAADHPLPTLLAAGVPVTLGTDDPGMFGTTLTAEYLLCHRQFGLAAADLAAIARTGVDASFCGTATRQALHRELDGYLAARLPLS